MITPPCLFSECIKCILENNSVQNCVNSGHSIPDGLVGPWHGADWGLRGPALQHDQPHAAALRGRQRVLPPHSHCKPRHQGCHFSKNKSKSHRQKYFSKYFLICAIFQAKPFRLSGAWTKSSPFPLFSFKFVWRIMSNLSQHINCNYWGIA